MLTALCIIDWALFAILALCVGYLFVYAFASLFYKERTFPATEHHHRFLVLFPAYAEDSVIVNSIRTFLKQDYPTAYYHVATISDHQKEKTIRELQQLPITTIIATYTDSSKAKALTLAIDTVHGEFDTVVILDADNLAPVNLLTEINKMRDVGIKAIQVHRKGLPAKSDVSILDGVSEEINNGIFRKGHQVLGISSALTGSGMAFDYQWFKEHIRKANTAGEDKELEAMLLRQKIHIIYSDALYVYDKKTEKQEAIGNQRKRWMASQFHLLLHVIPDLFKAFFSGNFAYADKIIQWMLPPRLIQLALVFGITFLSYFRGIDVCSKWLSLSILQILAMILPLPKEFRTRRMFQALAQIPQITLRIFVNLFHLKGASKKFIHTKHD